MRDGAWVRTPVDRFILAKLEASGLHPSPRASRDVLARRLSFTLTGLPPSGSLRELPFEAQVERLLASPAFGEHWARHWMDVVRYADTYGSEHDYLNPHAWRYRDYLVRAFNEDLPYDRFVQEQLAGDLLEWPRINPALGINESLLATAYQRMTEFYATPVDTVREQATVLDWQIENLGRAFLGLTISCARCHDHKFEPISTADFYALYGVFAGVRPVLNVVDAPEAFTQRLPGLLELKSRIREELAARWMQSPVDAGALRKTIDGAAEGSILTQLRPSGSPPRKGTPSRAQRLEAVLPLSKWNYSGIGLPASPLAAGMLSLHGSGEVVVRAIQPSGWFSDAATEKSGGSLRSPEFRITHRNLSVLASGTARARLRLVVEGCQADILLFEPANKKLENPTPRWLKMRMRDQWIGQRAHLEIMTRDDLPTVGTVKDVAAWSKSDGRSTFGMVDVVYHDDDAVLPPPPLPAEVLRPDKKHWEVWVADLNHLTRDAIQAWGEDRATDEQAGLLQMLLEGGLLPNKLEPGSPLGALVRQYRRLESDLPVPRRAPGVRDDGSGHDAPVFVRGDHLTPGEVVPRRMPEVLGGRTLRHARGDRYALAQELTRKENPLVARVMVNRIWHHLFGRGLVGSTDNFGRMGDKPSHPELLDYLALRFMEDGWSVKRLIRLIVTSETWQTSSQPTPESISRDPGNLLLAHARVRRLQAESIRDSMLWVAGNADFSLGGPSLHFHYRTVVDPDKQPPSGPLDGRGRRSLYLEVRRNFLSDFMTTFDFPRPNIPTGARSMTNVPAQSIALMNDPLVQHQAVVWARRLERLPLSLEARITLMYQEALGRPPQAAELAAAVDCLQVRSVVPVARDGSADAPVSSAWQDLAHAFFNMKEFIYIP